MEQQNILVVVDMQNDFVSGALGTPEAVEIVPRTVNRVAEAVARGEAVLFTRDTHGEEYLDTQEGRKLPIPHCIRGTEGWEIVPQLTDYASHPIDKPTFGSRELGALLQSQDDGLRKRGLDGIRKVTFIGLCTDICVISNALLAKAFLPEAEIAVDAACCAGVTPAGHQNALDAMRMCQITIENQP